MTLMLTIKSCCNVCPTIAVVLTVKSRFCFVQVEWTYQPWHKGRSLPPYCPYLATSNISPNNNVNANYNGHCSEKDIFPTSAGQIRPLNNVVHPMMSLWEWRQKWLGGWTIRCHWGNAQRAIQKEGCSRQTTRNALPKQRGDREMDWGLCCETNHWGKKASWRCRGSSSATAARYEECWKLGIDEQRARKDFSGVDSCYRRPSEWSCKFQQWGRWGRWAWWWDRAGQSERRWRTGLGDGHNHQNGTVANGEVSAEANEDWRIETTGMGGCSLLLLG